jgi:glycosyltransferase involved in cell wall biosynthesis
VTDQYPGRLALQQRVLPAYRAPLFDALAAACVGGLSVFAGQPRPDESIVSADRLHTAQLVRARNLHIGSLASPFYLCWQVGILNWLSACQPDALIVEANPRNPATRLAVRWMHARRRLVIGWGLGAPSLPGPLAAMRRWERSSFLRSLDAVVAYSRLGAQEYLSLGIPPDRVFVAPNAVTPRPSTPPPERSPQFDGPPRLLFVGRLQARKRIDNLLRACAALPSHLQPKLSIVGDGPARQEFQEFAAQVYPQAEFLGARHAAELSSIFAQADLFVLPGTGGLAVQEAMAHGLPVIVAQGDGTQGDLVRPENGWQIPPDDLESLTAALRQALSDAGRLRLMGRESYRIVAEEVNIDAMVAVFLQALSSLNEIMRAH